MRDKNDIMVRNFGTGLWGVPNVKIRKHIFSDKIDIVDVEDNNNVITINYKTAIRIADAIKEKK
jgi:hypothetical protein